MFEKKVIIMDGNNYFNRMYYSVDNSKETYFEEILNRFIAFKEKNIDNRIIFTFDTCKSARRLALFPGYKKGRDSHLTEEQKEHKRKGLNLFTNLIKYCGFATLEGNDYEADDYIACIVSMLKSRNNIEIISTDGDFYQLIGPNVSVYDPTKMVRIDESNFKYLIEVPKEYLMDYKCIVGDDSDKIPGVYLVGPKTAIRLIEEYGDLQNILNKLCEKQNRSKKENYLIENVEILNRNRKLMSLKIPIADKKLQEIIKDKIQNQTKKDLDALHKLLGEHGKGYLYKIVIRGCVV